MLKSRVLLIFVPQPYALRSSRVLRTTYHLLSAKRSGGAGAPQTHVLARQRLGHEKIGAWLGRLRKQVRRSVRRASDVPSDVLSDVVKTGKMLSGDERSVGISLFLL